MLFIHEIGHILVYFVIVFAIFLVTKKLSFSRVFLGFVVTMFMDADHLFDYFMYKGLTLNFTDFFASNYFTLSGKLYVLCHAWEYVAIFLAGYFMLKRKSYAGILLFIALGIGVHLVYDTLYYGFNPFGYSIIYRIISGFSLNVLHI